MNVFIVHAHPEEKSFCSSLKDTAVNTLREAGHEVQTTDLYTMNFNPVCGPNDFLNRKDELYFKPQLEQMHAFQGEGKLAADIRHEQEKLLWCDTLILTFPLWWFSFPAIMKGWVDRVFTMGQVYGGGKWYDKGGLAPRKAMLALTTGGGEAGYTRYGVNGDIYDLLFPIHHGILYFAGMTPLPPFVAYSSAHVDDTIRQKYVEEFQHRLLTLEDTEPLPFHPLDHYGEGMQLKDEYRA